MVSAPLPTSKSSSPFNDPLVTVPKAPIPIGIIVTFLFHVFQFLCKVEVLILLLTFFQFYSVVSRNSIVDNFSNCLFLLIIIISGLLVEIRGSVFFQAAVTSILLYGCTTWTLTKRLEKKLDGNYTRMLRAILNKSWLKHPTRHQLYGYLPPITKTIQVRRTRHAGHCWRSRDELIRDVLLWTPHTWQCKSRTTSTNIHSAAM